MGIFSAIANLAPMIGTLIAGPGGAAIGSVLKSEFGTDDPSEIEALVKSDPAAAARLKEIESNNSVELQRLVVQQAVEMRKADSEDLAVINETMRQEYMAGNAFKTGWRPFFGWTTGLGFLLINVVIMASISYVVFSAPPNSGDIMSGVSAVVGSLIPILSMQLAVLGVNISKRSQDKAVMSGQEYHGLLGKFLSRGK